MECHQTAKVTAVPVEQPEEGLAKAWNDEQPTEAKTDAEQMTDVINEVKITDDTRILTTEYVEPEPKPKASKEAGRITGAAKPRASRAKPKVEETKPTVEDAKPEVVEVKPANQRMEASCHKCFLEKPKA